MLRRYGSLGEQLVVTMEDGEVIDRTLSLVPVRITVVVTLRELQPLAGKTQKLVSTHRATLSSGPAGLGWARMGWDGMGWDAHT